MKISRALIFLTFFVFFLLRLALTSDDVVSKVQNDMSSLINVTEDPSTSSSSVSEKVLKSDLLKTFDLSKIFNEASNEIGLPFALRQTLVEALRERGLLNVKGVSMLVEKDSESSARDYGGGGGCSDSFAVFGFLAFLLALVDLLIDLGIIMTGRRKRSNERWGDVPDESSCHEEYRQLALREGTLASYSLLRGFLNSMDAHDAFCSDRFMCEAAKEAALLGKIGQTFAKVSSSNAKSWLEHIDPNLHFGTDSAILKGIELASSGRSCQEIYQCADTPKSYKYPGFKGSLETMETKNGNF